MKKLKKFEDAIRAVELFKQGELFGVLVKPKEGFIVKRECASLENAQKETNSPLSS